MELEDLLRLDKERIMLAYCDSPDKVAGYIRNELTKIILGEQGKLMVGINHCIKCKYYKPLLY